MQVSFFDTKYSMGFGKMGGLNLSNTTARLLELTPRLIQAFSACLGNK